MVFSAGVRPRDQLARDGRAGRSASAAASVVDARLPHRRPGTSTRSASAPLSTAAATGWSRRATRWPRSSPTGCSAARPTFPGADLSTKLKLLGVDVASFGDAHGTTEGALEVVSPTRPSGIYAKLVVSDDAQTLLGGILVGDASAYATLRPLVGGDRCPATRPP